MGALWDQLSVPTPGPGQRRWRLNWHDLGTSGGAGHWAGRVLQLLLRTKLFPGLGCLPDTLPRTLLVSSTRSQGGEDPQHPNVKQPPRGRGGAGDTVTREVTKCTAISLYP